MKLICFLPWGYPSQQRSHEMAELYLKAGCDAIEISIPPKDAYLDNEYLRKVMGEAWRQEPDPKKYLEEIRALKRAHPKLELLIMAYVETIREIGAAEWGAFCREIKAEGVISGDLEEGELMDALRGAGVPLAARANFTMTEEMVQSCRNTTGFVYQRAVPAPGQVVREGCETLERCIRYLKENGVKQPIYCGMGIKIPADAAAVAAAGADGCFVGSSLVSLYEKPEALLETIAEYRRATLGG